MIKKVDLDGSGEVSFTEYLTLMAQLKHYGEIDEQMSLKLSSEYLTNILDYETHTDKCIQYCKV